MNISESDMKYLKLLSKSYGTIEEARAEIINLSAIQNLPKGTEHFLSDIHGEYEPFLHILRNASGVIKLKIDEIFNELSPKERKSLATLIYYPEEKLEIIKQTESDMTQFYRRTLHRLLRLLEFTTFKYTRSYVRKQIPKEYAYIIEELLYGSSSSAPEEAAYKETIIESIIAIDAADDFISKMWDLITRLSVYHLHILGDIYDRGPGADIVISALVKHYSVDIQWGNHDILWMGAAAGNNPVHANGRAFVIDGGFAKAYQKTTGIAGYSLIYNSYGFILTAHEAFDSKARAVMEETDILATQVAKEETNIRLLNKDTDIGLELKDKIDGLKTLLNAYRSGMIKQEAGR